MSYENFSNVYADKCMYNIVVCQICELLQMLVDCSIEVRVWRQFVDLTVGMAVNCQVWKPYF